MNRVPRKKPVQRERREQNDVLKALAPVCDRVYVLGTTRMPRCTNCGEMLARAHFTTRQTPGISDVYGFLKAPTYPRPDRLSRLPSAVWVEVKAGKNKPTPEQIEFADLCRARGIAHVTGGVNDVIAFLIAGGWLRADNVPHYRLPSSPDVAEDR